MGTSRSFGRALHLTLALGVCACSGTASSSHTDSLPGAPTGVMAVAGDAKATVSWTAPASGSSSITGYTVTATPGGFTASTAAGVTSATITGLTDGTPYTFTVHATSAGGNGPESAPSAAVAPTTGLASIAAFDGVVAALMSKYAIPGAAIAATYQERLVYVRGYGDADVSASQAVTAESLFRLASVSKPITSITIMRLVEQGKLSLSDHVFGAGGLLGTTYGTLPYGPHITDITVDHLLHHTGGGWPNDGTDPMFTNPTLTAAQLISWTLDNRPLTTVPGAAYAYSNFGYCVLGRVIEAVTGESYEQAVDDLVLTPAGITDMTIGGNTLADRLPGEVVYYGQGGEDPYGMNVSRMDSHGGWVASARDLAKLLVRVDGFTRKPDLLAPGSIAAMITPSAANPNYACGWAVNSADNWWHIGSLPGTTTEIIRAHNGWNWVLLTNTRSTSASFDTDVDAALWTALSGLTDIPTYDLF